MRHHQRETRVGLQRPRLRRAHPHAETRRARLRAVFAEDHAGHGQVKRADAVEGDDGDGFCSRDGHGPILSMIGYRATFDESVKGKE
jgi:hypothetical protein